MKSLFARLSVTSTLAIVSAGVLTISMFVVGIILYQVALGQAQTAAIKKQDVNLRVAATIFQDRVEGAISARMRDSASSTLSSGAAAVTPPPSGPTCRRP